MNSKVTLKVDRYIFTREVFGYCFTLGLLMGCLNHGSFKQKEFQECLSVRWYIGLILMVGYVYYALVVIYFDWICVNWFGREPTKIDDSKIEEEVTNPVRKSIDGRNVSVAQSSRNSSMSHTISIHDVHDLHSSAHTESIAARVLRGENPLAEEDMSCKKRAMIFLTLCVTYFTFPLRMLVAFTIPDLTVESNRPYYVRAALVSILWLGGLAQLLLICIDTLGNFIGISHTMMGLTIGAWGASMPTLWSSMVVAKKGFGDMALSNAIGANVFSVLFGLGLPWFAYPLYINDAYEGIQDSGIQPLLLILMINALFYFFMIHYCDYVLSFW